MVDATKTHDDDATSTAVKVSNRMRGVRVGIGIAHHRQNTSIAHQLHVAKASAFVICRAFPFHSPLSSFLVYLQAQHQTTHSLSLHNDSLHNDYAQPYHP